MQRTASERDQPVETPSTPVESLVKKLTTERVVELKKVIAEEQQQYVKLMEEINLLQGPSIDDPRIHEMWAEIEQEKIQKEQEQVKYNQWLKEREDKRIEMERQWRPNYGLNKSPSVVKKPVESEPTEQLAGTPTPSPLLTSLLKTSQASAARSAPTITNLLTGTSSLPSLPSSSIHSPIKTPPIIIHSVSVQIPASQMAPTLVTLLDRKPEDLPATSEAIPEKDEEAELLADFNELIAGNEKFDDEDLMEDINEIIMNPEILEEKIAEPIKDVDDSSQATSTDDYDKLKIKQLVEDFAAVPESVEEPEVIPVDAEVSNSTDPESVEMVEQVTESNDSKVESVAEVPQDDKVMVISDESNDGKKDEDEKIDDESSKNSEISKISEVLETKETADVFQVEDSDEDVLFEDAKENHEESTKEVEEVKEPEAMEVPEKFEEKTDSEDDVKVTRNSRKKAAEAAVAPTTRSRDNSENDDTRETKPIRTRSRHSSTITEPKSTFNFPKEQDHSMWKARWDDCAKEVQKLANYSAIVDNKLFADDSFKSVILSPMTMKIIQKNIENHVATMPNDVKRDFALMCTNIVMLNKKGPKFNENVQQFMKEGMEIIDDKLEVEDAYKSYRKQIKKKP